MRHRPSPLLTLWVGLSLGFIFSTVAFGAGEGVLDIRVRHAKTGVGLQASIKLQRLPGKTFEIHKRVTYHDRFSLAPGLWSMTATADGFQPYSLQIHVTPGKHIHLDILLLPANPSSHATTYASTTTLLRGYLIDPETGRPIPNAILRLQLTRLQTRSNSVGFFQFQLTQKHQHPIPLADRLLITFPNNRRQTTLDVDLRSPHIYIIDVPKQSTLQVRHPNRKPHGQPVRSANRKHQSADQIEN